MSPRPMDPIIKAMRRIDVRAPYECWEWTGGMADNTPRVGLVGNTSMSVPRLLFERFHGALSANELVTRACGNNKCCNPLHLTRSGPRPPRAKRRRQSLDDRFWSKVDKSGDCWRWTSAFYTDGYGMLFVSQKAEQERVGAIGRNVRAHRIAWALANGRAPDRDLVVMHSCDNPACVNPAHLSLGTISDNVRDMVAKGRHRNQGARAAAV